MGRRLNWFGWILIGLVVGLSLTALVGVFLTRTGIGGEAVRRIAVGQLQRRINGELRVGGISTRGLLFGVTLYDVAIADENGRPFVRVDRARLSWDWRNLLRGRFIFTRLTADTPQVVLEKLPGDTLWNYERIFNITPDGEGPNRLIQIDRVRISDGLFIVRTPFLPEEPVEPADTARLILRAAPGGLQRELRFENVNANLPRVLWESPREEGKLLEIRSLATRGYIWEDPVDVRDLRGVVTIRDSVISFDVERLRLPHTRASGVGRIVTGEERVRYDVRIEGDEVALRDLQWLYPPLPEEGGGSLVFRIQSQPVGTLWLAQDAHLRAPGTRIDGTFGIVTGDTLYFTQVDLRASPLNLKLLEEILPGELPVEGLMVGTVEVEGPISSLTTRGDVRLTSLRPGRSTSAVRWSGTVDLRPPYAVQGFDAEVRGLDLSLLRRWRPDLDLRGVVSGRVRATGRLDRAVRFAGSLRHQGTEGPPSVVEGSGTFRSRGRLSDLDVTLTAQPVALQGIAPLLPGSPSLRGEIRGPVSLRGSRADLAVEADLASDVGRLRVAGRFDLSGEAPRYQAEGRIADVVLARLHEKLPHTQVNARFSVDGEGVGVEALRAGVRLELEDTAWVGKLAVPTGAVRLSIRDGLAAVDSLVVASAAGRIEARGAIGLDAAHDGVLRLRADLDSIAELEPLVFGDALPVVAAVDSVGARLAGSASLEAELSGSLADLAVSGEARLERLVYDDVTVGRASLRFGAERLATDSIAYRVEATADTLNVFGQRLSTVRASAEYAALAGLLTVEAGGSAPQPSAYRLVSGFRRSGADTEFDLREVAARNGAEAWALAEPARLRLGSSGVAIDHLLLERVGGAGRVRATGRLPWSGGDRDPARRDLAADFHLEVQQLPVFSLRNRPPAETPAYGLLSGTVAVTGTAAAPRIRADLSLADLSYGDMRVDTVAARLDYADLHLDAAVEARHRGTRILAGDGRIPLDLTLAPVGERRLDAPLRLTLRADDVPAVVFTSMVDGFRNVQGSVDGTVLLTGTTREPVLGGELAISNGAATWVVSGVRYRDVRGTLRMREGQVVAVEASARAGDGTATVTGTMTFRELDDPTFDLALRAREFEGARRRDVEMVGTGEIFLTGRYTRPEVRGSIRVDRGALFLDEVWRQYQIVGLDDPSLFQVVDTTVVSMRTLERAITNEFLRNLRVNAQVDVGRDSWLRGRNLNVEVSGSVGVEFDNRAEDLRLTGTLAAIRGSYEFFIAETMPVRRFTVREGTVEFDGTPGINPNLDITAVYRVRQESGPLNVQAVVTGTLEDPRLSLRSDAQPPISESDLLSYLIFGRPTYELARRESQEVNRALSFVGGVGVPTLLGYAATGLETFASQLGLVDYIAITEWEGGTGDSGRSEAGSEFERLLQRSQVEVGSYFFRDALYLAVTRRLASPGKSPDFGWRAEWRFHPTWTAELFYENRFARTPGLTIDPGLQGRRAGGFFLFREWGTKRLGRDD